MKRTTRTVRAALATLALSASFAVATTTQAAAINHVPCSSNDFLQVTMHHYRFTYTDCFANAGENSIGTDTWVTRISTGNNRVQWHGDGRWQPATPIAKNTVYQWPNHPGGVRIDGIRIL
ncbi:beta/gamma crystallin domain-containing protein [Streptomyces sp. OM5714]|uniref:beta/gamma crystallin domain-containing protein n=1 Tax=Streptomyces sp. OM5714 TaxID=2602736 RepID=UPI0013D9C6D2|nr:beta/gamma crystallin domain-containing protein [Streptomyces sp. OM5714]